MRVDDKVKVIGRSNLARVGHTGVVVEVLKGAYTLVRFGTAMVAILTADLEVVCD